MDLNRLDAAVHRYCHAGLAASTHKTYTAAVNRFRAFCSHYGIVDMFPVNELLLCRFVAFLANEGLAPPTIKTYLAGVRHMQIMQGYPEPRREGSMPRLKLLQSGVAKERVKNGVATAGKLRLPITPQLLRGLMDAWAESTSATQEQSRDRAMLRAVATMCYFGFFRSGELTIPTATSFDERRHLSWGDVAVDDKSPPSTVRVRLKYSKCDQLGKGVEVFMGRTETSPCPVSEVVRYVSMRGPAPGPFFKFHNGRPLTKALFIRHVREALAGMGVDSSAYAGHSFRIGAATAAAEAGLEDSVIRLLGRWNSDAFLRYVRTPREMLAAYSKNLCSGRAVTSRP